VVVMMMILKFVYPQFWSGKLGVAVNPTLL
jgi:hypothetical protein